MANRPKGVFVYDSAEEVQTQKVVVEAKKVWVAEKNRLRTQRAERRERPVPNYLCYPDAFKLYDPKTGRWHGGKLPRCERCKAFLQPEENHKCEGFVPQYIDHDDEWRERADARRAEQREAIHNRWDEMREESLEDDREYQDEFENRTTECDDCGEELHGLDDAQTHDCPARD
jgi:hypothetical protein